MLLRLSRVRALTMGPRALPIVLGLHLALGCSEQNLRARQEPVEPQRPAASDDLVPDRPDSPGRPPGLGLEREPLDGLADPPACPQRPLAVQGLEADACRVEGPSGPPQARLRWEVRLPLVDNHELPPIVPPRLRGAPEDASSRMVGAFLVGGGEMIHTYDLGLPALVDQRDGLGSLMARMRPGRWFLSPTGEAWVVPWRDAMAVLPLGGDLSSDEGWGAPCCSRFTDGYRIVDLDRDGVPELVFAGLVYGLDGTLLADLGGDLLVQSPAFVDANGDGDLEIVLGHAIFDRRGDELCRVDTGDLRSDPRGATFLVDLDGDDQVDVLVLPAKVHPDVPVEELRVQDLNCLVRRSVGVSDVHSSAHGFSSVSMIAPMLERTLPAVAVVLSPLGSSSSERHVLLDHELRPAGVLPVGVPYFSAAVDLNGDGIFGVVTRVRHEYADGRFGRVGAELGLWHYDAVTDEVTSLDAGAPDMFAFADIDDDGAVELVTLTTDFDGEWHTRLAVYESRDGRWSSGYRGFYNGFEPYLHRPDGTPWEGPVPWRHTGMLQAMPTTDWWTGRRADLVVRIADVCLDECAEGWATAWIQAGNQGQSDIARPVLLRLYGEREDGTESLLGQRTLPEARRGFWSVGHPIRFVPDGIVALRATVEGDGWEVAECDTTNNEAYEVFLCSEG